MNELIKGLCSNNSTNRKKSQSSCDVKHVVREAVSLSKHFITQFNLFLFIKGVMLTFHIYIHVIQHIVANFVELI